ncbi:MAG: lipoyl synthase [Candidatus Lokiarchaeota archaeon]|nr:lipoyl synthase [Candidatus Lokiarchaeota archaeon]
MSTKPPWICRRVPPLRMISKMQSVLDELKIHTICESAGCPNLGLCYEKKFAAFLILGNVCSRTCKFCGVKKGKQNKIDANEPKRVARAVKKLNLKHVVITSVTRDDLDDQGVNQFIKTIKEIRSLNPATTTEILIPDFQGDEDCIHKILQVSPEIINHNIEVVPRLYPKLRPEANYERSLNLLKQIKSKIKEKQILLKTGLMIGHGENIGEIYQTINNLYRTGCDILTIGQYLQPTPNQVKVKKFYQPKFFKELDKYSKSIGFRYVYSAPFIRSSFNAQEIYQLIKEE